MTFEEMQANIQKKRAVADNPYRAINDPWLQRQVVPLAGGLVAGAGDVAGGIGQAASMVEQLFGGDGVNPITRLGDAISRPANRFSEQAMEFAADPFTGETNLFQDVAQGVGQSAANIGLGVGLNALTGGGTGLMQSLVNPAIGAFRATSEALGEASRTRQELEDQGATQDEANRQANMVALYNTLAGVPTEILGGQVSKVLGRLPGAAGAIGAGVGQGFEEGFLDEPGQNIAQEAATQLNADGSPVTMAQYAGRVMQGFKDDYLSQLAEVGPSSFLSAALTGTAAGYENNVRVSREQEAQQNAIQLATQQAQSAQAYRSQPETVTAPQIPVQETSAVLEDVQQIPLTPVEQAVQEVAPEVQQAPQANVEARATQIQRQETQQAQATRRQQVMSWAQQELNSLTEQAGEYTDEGDLANPMADEDRQYATLIQKAMADNDLNTLEEIMNDSSSTENMMIGAGAKGIDAFNYNRAADMLQKGTDPARVKKQTGWMVGPDNRMRFEIPDDIRPIQKNMPTFKYLEENGPQMMRFGDLYEGPLTGMYPQLKNVDVVVDTFKDGDTYSGQYNSNGVINLKVKRGAPGAATRTFFHETQHAVQHLEGFARGTNLKSVARAPINTQRINELEKLRDSVKDNPELVNELDTQIKGLRSDMRAMPAENKYWNTAGEREARDTGLRAGLTAAQLRKTPREYSQDDLLIRYPDAYREGIAATGPREGETFYQSKEADHALVKRLANTPVKNWSDADANALYDVYYKDSDDRRLVPPELMKDYVSAKKFYETLDVFHPTDDITAKTVAKVKDIPVLGDLAQKLLQVGQEAQAQWNRMSAPGFSRSSTSPTVRQAFERYDALNAEAKGIIDDVENFVNNFNTADYEKVSKLLEDEFEWKDESAYQTEYQTAATQKTAPADARPVDNTSLNLQEDGEVYNDVVTKLKDIGITGAEAEANAKLYDVALKNFGKMVGADPVLLWKNMDAQFKTEDLSSANARGSITVERSGSKKALVGFSISLDPKQRNLNTLFHEQGHLFTELVRSAALLQPDNVQLQDSWNALKKFAGAESNTMSDWTREQKEKLANAYMNYVMKGELPNPGLKPLFDRFKAWLTNFWSTVTEEEKVDYPEDVRKVFDNLLATDAGFDYTYSPVNDRVNNNYTDAKVKAASAKSGAKLSATKKGNITTVTKQIDRSDSVDFVKKELQSPDIMAEKFSKFAYVYSAGNSALREQDTMRRDFNHSLDKIWGKPGLLGVRSGGMLQTQEDKDGFYGALIHGDAMGMELTDADLKAVGATDNAIKAYKTMRIIYKKIGARINAQRRELGLEEMELREGYIPHVFQNWRVHDDTGLIIDSFRSLKEATAFAKTIAKGDREITIKPAVHDFQGQAKMDAIVLGDTQFNMFVSKIADTFALSGKDAKDFAGDVARKASKARWFGNAQFREGYAGYNMDMEFIARRYANNSARYMAMNKFKHNTRRYFERVFGRFDREYKGIAQYTKNYMNDLNGVPTGWEEAESKFLDAWGITKLLPNDYQDRPAIQLANTITSKTSMIKLALMNVGSAAMNLTSLNGVQAKTGLINTSKAVAKYTANAGHPSLELRKLYEAVGLDTDITMEAASGYTTANVAKSTVRKLSSGLFSVMDMASRKIAAIAGYEKALKEGKNRTEAYAYAREVVDQTNFNYGVSDSPEAFRRHGATGQLVMQFKKYPVKILELGFHHLEGAEKVKFWGGMLLMSGITGAVPGFQFFNMMAKAMFPEEDLELEIKRILAELPLPNPIRLSLMYGAMANAGIDISGRAGVSDVIPSRVGDLAGPGLGTLYDIVTQLPKLGDGWGGAVDIIQAIAPGVSNPMKAFYGETEDARTGRTRFAYDGMGERLARAAGFTPTRERLANDAQRIVNMEERQDTAAQRAAIAAYLEERTPANRDRLRSAGVTTAQLRRALRERAKPGGALENAMRRTRRPENRQFMERYAAM